MPDTLDAGVTGLLAGLLSNGPAAVRACERLAQDMVRAPNTPALRADIARRVAALRAGAQGRDHVPRFLHKSRPAWLAE